MINTKLGIHPQTLISFSGAYDNVEKCLAEFVDNSIDNAVEFLRDENLNFYFFKIFKLRWQNQLFRFCYFIDTFGYILSNKFNPNLFTLVMACSELFNSNTCKIFGFFSNK